MERFFLSNGKTRYSFFNSRNGTITRNENLIFYVCMYRVIKERVILVVIEQNARTLVYKSVTVGILELYYMLSMHPEKCVRIIVRLKLCHALTVTHL